MFTNSLKIAFTRGTTCSTRSYASTAESGKVNYYEKKMREIEFDRRMAELDEKSPPFVWSDLFERPLSTLRSQLDYLKEAMSIPSEVAKAPVPDKPTFNGITYADAKQEFKTWQVEAEERQHFLDSLPDEDAELYTEIEGMPIPLARHHTSVITVFKQLNIPKDQWESTLAKYNLSAGVDTLEDTLPSPPPFHTFDELPIVKETSEPSHD
mmetsp:Transcript_8375/g.12739  ORF Transcript_8375/g.12739 Transcript_8375/m.12739 type:complete len:210 (-) Transcript_8375:51-680(-)|eukprot:CAMPEP_0201544338 /NCGR_PEP_ID=MMETSP0173_2-20130828/938_1 /ASSEMBLY_ACC=CAM_ASM_000268 /TAXON_ID=218659 /ORGANISM="Vexillifera sp., Strain DIVA3 564/2" /LENGTH=209 /DNA_ID=CAMNT_0047952415 /DNA_START=1230 /DNA_END=1859 /DNA_ORIENTATION=-